MKRMTSLAFLLAISAFGASVAAQQADQPGRDAPTATTATDEPTVPKRSVAEQLKFLLSGYEYFPTRADLDAVAKPDVIIATLTGFVANEKLRTTLRLRAIDALGHYDDADAAQFLAATIAEPLDGFSGKQKRARTLFKHHAITSLARANKEGAVPALRAVLDTSDPQLRITAISALGKHGGATGKSALASLKDVEKSELVLRELRKWVR